jgi:group I intron endonuclease
MLGGIYCIENLYSRKKYFGQSVNINKRKQEHFRTLRKGEHKNRYLQNAYNKYGEDNFRFQILLYCEPFELTKYEQFFVNNNNFVYNISLECVNSTLGITYSDEVKEKFKEINGGKNNPMYGKKHSIETKNRMSQIAIGNKNPSKLDWEKVRKIRKFYKGESMKNNHKGYLWDIIRKLSKKYDIGQTAIYDIVSNKSWKEGADHSCRSIGLNGDIQ